MSNKLYFLSLVTILSLGVVSAGAQGLAVNTTGATANASAILDVSSTTQGALVPRMTSAQRTAITVGATQTGLLVYQTDGAAGFYFYNGSAWTSLNVPGSAAGGDLAGSYPNPTISSSAGTGNDIVTAVNASTGGLSGTGLAAGSVSMNALSATGRTTSNFLSGNNTWQTVSGGATLSAGSTAGQVYVTGTGGAVPTTPVTVSGDATLAATGALTLANTGVTAGTYGSATTLPQITVDAKGRVTSINNQSPFGAIATGTTISTSSSSPTAIPAADQIFYFNLPSSANGFISLPAANLFSKGYKIYAYPGNAPLLGSDTRTVGKTFGIGPASGNTLVYENSSAVTYGTSSANFYNGLFLYAVCISDGVSAWYMVLAY